MGVVVNRPSGVTVAEALKNHFELPESGEMVYVGGPVEHNALFILHNADDLDGSEKPVIDGVYVGSSPDTFESIVKRAAEGADELKFRVYFGCAGWGPDQLEGELARSDWLVIPAAVNYVYHPDPLRRLEVDGRRIHPRQSAVARVGDGGKSRIKLKTGFRIQDSG